MKSPFIPLKLEVLSWVEVVNLNLFVRVFLKPDPSRPDAADSCEKAWIDPTLPSSRGG